MIYKNYPFIYANTRSIQNLFSFYRVFTVYQEILVLEFLEKDIGGLKRKEGIKKKNLKSKTLRNIHVKLRNI